MENLETKKESKGTQISIDKEALNNVIYTNIITVLSYSDDEVEVGLCVKNPDGSAEVKQRVFFSIGHFHRVANLFMDLSSSLKGKE